MDRILYFYTKWAGPCDKQTSILKQLEDIYGDRLQIDYFDADEREKEANHHGVLNLPTIILMKDHEPVERFVGVTERHEIENTAIQYDLIKEEPDPETEPEPEPEPEGKSRDELLDDIQELRERAGLEDTPDPDFE